MPELKVTLSEDTLAFLNQYFPDGLKETERARIAIGVLRYLTEEDREALKEYLHEEGIEDLHFEELYARGVADFLHEAEVEQLDMEAAFAEGVKRAILESEDFSLSDLAGLIDGDSE